MTLYAIILNYLHTFLSLNLSQNVNNSPRCIKDQPRNSEENVNV